MTNASQPRREPGLVQLDSGKWRCKLSATDPRTGQRIQQMKTFPTKKAALAWRTATLADIARGEHSTPALITFAELAASWLADKQARVRPVTHRGYVTALKPALLALGDTKVQQLGPEPIRRLIRDHAKTHAKGSTNLMLLCIRASLDRAVQDGVISRNPAAHIQAAGRPAKRRRELPAADANLIAAHVHGHRLEAVWTLTLCGLRRSEAMGVRWGDWDETAGTLSVERGRLEGFDGTTPPKTERGRRVLPLPDHVTAALRRTRALRKAEHLALGVPWSEGSYIACDEALEPLRPEWYSDQWLRTLAALGIERLTLHSARHGSVSRMLSQGIPVHMVAAWHGHDASLTLSVYAHADPVGLAAAGRSLFQLGAQA